MCETCIVEHKVGSHDRRVAQRSHPLRYSPRYHHLHGQEHMGTTLQDHDPLTYRHLYGILL